MRWIGLLVFALAAAQALSARDFKVTTWNLKWFPSGSANTRNPSVEEKRVADVADVLREIDPDVILLQEVRDEESAVRLCEAIAPHRYQIVIVSRFRDGFGVGWQQLVIVAKIPAKVAYARPWKTFGLVDPPRGFAFACFEIEERNVAVYAVHLKSNLAQGDNFRSSQLNILKRELAMQQVVEHLTALTEESEVKPDVVVIGGDFNTSPDDLRFVSEKTLRIGEDAGFANPILVFRADQRVTLPGDGKYPPATFDYVLVRGAASPSVGVRQTNASDHWPVSATLSLP